MNTPMQLFPIHRLAFSRNFSPDSPPERHKKRHRCVQPVQQLASCWLCIQSARFHSLKKPPMEAYLTLLRESNGKAVIAALSTAC